MFRYGIKPGQSTLERYGLLAQAYERGDLKLEDWWMTRTRDTHRTGRQGRWGAGIGDLLDQHGGGSRPSARSCLD